MDLTVEICYQSQRQGTLVSGRFEAWALAFHRALDTAPQCSTGQGKPQVTQIGQRGATGTGEKGKASPLLLAQP